MFGVSSNFRHLCAAAFPGRAEFFRYDWKGTGAWNLAFAAGILAGGFLAGVVFRNPEPLHLSARTQEVLAAFGITDFSGFAPRQIFSWAALGSPRTLICVPLGGFLVGFGATWAGGCTSGHAITGLADLQLPSLIAVCGFFAGGLLVTFGLMPILFGAG